MRRSIGALAGAAALLGFGFCSIAGASPVQAASELIVLHSFYENKPGATVKFECLASPTLVGKTAQIKEVGGSFLRSITIRENGSCGVSLQSVAKGEHEFVVVVQYQLANGKTKTVRSNVETLLVGRDS